MSTIYSGFILLFYLFFVICLTTGIRLRQLIIPRHVYVGQNVTLKCEYDLGDAQLYSVKWYKDNSEIYSYIPSYDSPERTYQTDGVYIDVSQSRPESITLIRVESSTSGMFACEVSEESLDFHTKYIEKQMDVHELPNHGPSLTESRDTYRIGERVVVNCTSPLAVPAPQLSWFINNRKVGGSHLVRFPVTNFSDGFQQSRLGLRFTLKKKMLRSGHVVRLRCQALLGKFYEKSKEHIIVVKRNIKGVLHKSVKGDSAGRNPDDGTGKQKSTSSVPSSNRSLPHPFRLLIFVFCFRTFREF